MVDLLLLFFGRCFRFAFASASQAQFQSLFCHRNAYNINIARASLHFLVFCFVVRRPSRVVLIVFSRFVRFLLFRPF